MAHTYDQTYSRLIVIRVFPLGYGLWAYIVFICIGYVHLKRHHIQANISHGDDETATHQNQFTAQLAQIISSRKQNADAFFKSASFLLLSNFVE